MFINQMSRVQSTLHFKRVCKPWHLHCILAQVSFYNDNILLSPLGHCHGFYSTIERVPQGLSGWLLFWKYFYGLQWKLVVNFYIRPQFQK